MDHSTADHTGAFGQRAQLVRLGRDEAGRAKISAKWNRSSHGKLFAVCHGARAVSRVTLSLIQHHSFLL
jgi:hypothetical protein